MESAAQEERVCPGCPGTHGRKLSLLPQHILRRVWQQTGTENKKERGYCMGV